MRLKQTIYVAKDKKKPSLKSKHFEGILYGFHAVTCINVYLERNTQCSLLNIVCTIIVSCTTLLKPLYKTISSA